MLLVYLRSFVGWTLLVMLCIPFVLLNLDGFIVNKGERIAQIILQERCIIQGGALLALLLKGGALFQGELVLLDRFYFITWLVLSHFYLFLRDHVILAQSCQAFALVLGDWESLSFYALCSICAWSILSCHMIFCALSALSLGIMWFFCLSRVESLPLA